MELLSGETLENHVRENRALPLPEALPLIVQIGAAHQIGIVHRNLKPSNVTLVPGTGGSRAVVTDFGLARSTTGVGSQERGGEETEEITDTLTGRLAGTPDYMAPELFTGVEANVASDVYAFGLTIYLMVTASPPFRAKKQGIETGLDAGWSEAILRAIHPDPSQRVQSAGDLTRALRGESPAAVRATGFRRRHAIAVAATAAAAATIWASGRLRRGRNEQPSAEALRLY